MYNPGDAHDISVMPTFGRGQGGTERVMRIRFMVRNQGPFSIDVPAANFDPKDVEKRVLEFATKITDTLDMKL